MPQEIKEKIELENILKRLMRLENEVFKTPPQSVWFPIKLSARGRKIFPHLIGEKAYKVISRKKIPPNCIRVKILGKKTNNTYSKVFWEEN